MNRIEKLSIKYKEFSALPWDNVAAPQRTWFIVYPPDMERQLRRRIDLFELASKKAGHKWIQVDLTCQFAEWMANLDYRERYFKKPKHLAPKQKDFQDRIVEVVNKSLLDPAVDDNTVVALTGVGSLYGLMRVSDLINKITPNLKGRLAVFFPGEYEDKKYRLLDGQDGWNYLAVPITL